MARFLLGSLTGMVASLVVIAGLGVIFPPVPTAPQQAAQLLIAPAVPPQVDPL